MTSARKVAANRTNARASTGPKSAAGKRRSAMNARRHGLSIPVLLDPAWSSAVRALAREIAGNDASSEQQEHACRIAAAQIDVLRVRQARLDLIKQHQANENFQSALAFKKTELIIKHQEELPQDSVRRLLTALARKLIGAEKLATIISDLSVTLNQFDRYERRALSRRKFAIRDFDKAR